jgi:hypothetical protein
MFVRQNDYVFEAGQKSSRRSPLISSELVYGQLLR